MPLAPGTRLGPYEILSPLGAGGMGEVYRARDTRLDRDVAVKVLPAHLSTHPEIRARFEREAKAISSLNHPHICTLHDVGREGDTDYLVMELVEGETLAQRIARGPLPVGEILRLGGQIAGALSRAHRAGVVHRDLKPGNVMLTKSGAKLMDFGLARATAIAGRGEGSDGATGGSMTHAPTVAAPLTAEGAIVGTFQYMAPEQLEGREADARSDIWALGCVLYEMATGRRAFQGKSQASLIGAVMNAEPAPMSELSPMAPPALERLVRRCLAKDPDDRIQTAHDVGIHLDWIGEPASRPAAGAHGAVPARGASRESWAWAIVAASLIVAAIALAGAFRTEAPARRIVSSIGPPEGAKLSLDTGPMALSRDGRAIAMVARNADGKDLLWVRPLDRAEARPLAGTEGASCPFWSPDGKSIGFFAQRKLKKVEIAGGQPEVIASARICVGASWGEDGSILYVPDTYAPVMRVPSGGGSPSEITPSPGSVTSRSFGWPLLLPDGRHFLYTASAAPGGSEGGDPESGIFVGSLDAPAERRRVLPIPSNAIYAPPGYLIYAKDGALRAQRLDPTRFEVQGEPIVLAERVRYLASSLSYLFSASADGHLAYLAGAGGEMTRFAWFDRTGTLVEDLPLTALLYVPRLSHDGRRVAFDRSDPITNSGDIWVYDFTRKVSDRVTFDPRNESWPAWSPDDARIVFFRNNAEYSDIFLVNADGTGTAEPLLAGPEKKRATDWSPDGRFIALEYATTEFSTRNDVWLYSFEEKKAAPWLATPFNEVDAHFSPDGRWIAYRSDESGRDEIYVRERAAGGRKWRISSEGGAAARWRSDGKELFFIAPDEKVMSVAVAAGATFDAGTPGPLFTPAHPATVGNPASYDVAPDGKRFLLNLRSSDPDGASITLVTHWTAAAKE